MDFRQFFYSFDFYNDFFIDDNISYIITNDFIPIMNCYGLFHIYIKSKRIVYSLGCSNYLLGYPLIYVCNFSSALICVNLRLYNLKTLIYADLFFLGFFIFHHFAFIARIGTIYGFPSL